jgi:hypothetical protein
MMLLCQLAAAAHPPMLQARIAGNVPAASHCAEHSQPRALSHTDRGTAPMTRDSGHPGCGCGLCQCPCAQVPPLVSALSVPPVLTEHHPVTLPYRVPEFTRHATAFFRPPI